MTFFLIVLMIIQPKTYATPYEVATYRYQYIVRELKDVNPEWMTLDIWGCDKPYSNTNVEVRTTGKTINYLIKKSFSNKKEIEIWERVQDRLSDKYKVECKLVTYYTEYCFEI